MIRILRTAIITAVIGGAVFGAILWSNWSPEAPIDNGPATLRAKQFAQPKPGARAELAKQREKRRLQKESDPIRHNVADLLAGESELPFPHFKKLLEYKLAGRDTISGRELRRASEEPDGRRDPLAQIKASSSGKDQPTRSRHPISDGSAVNGKQPCNSQELIAMLSGFRKIGITHFRRQSFKNVSTDQTALAAAFFEAVSYTHLTLPTIYSV